MPNQLKQIGTNCKKIKRLSFDYFYIYETKPFENIVKAINDNFLRLKRLRFYSQFPEEFVLKSESLNKCRHLTHLYVYQITNCYLNDPFFANINTNLPKLENLELHNVEITDTSLELLSKLARLNYLKPYGFIK